MSTSKILLRAERMNLLVNNMDDPIAGNDISKHNPGAIDVNHTILDTDGQFSAL